ncbi:hypothetical protein Gotur_025791 [Gossypium turneri]
MWVVLLMLLQSLVQRQTRKQI